VSSRPRNVRSHPNFPGNHALQGPRSGFLRWAVPDIRPGVAPSSLPIFRGRRGGSPSVPGWERPRKSFFRDLQTASRERIARARTRSGIRGGEDDTGALRGNAAFAPVSVMEVKVSGYRRSKESEISYYPRISDAGKERPGPRGILYYTGPGHTRSARFGRPEHHDRLMGTGAGEPRSSRASFRPPWTWRGGKKNTRAFNIIEHARGPYRL